MTTNTELSNKAMLVRLHISQWTARRYDKTVTEKVRADYEADSDCGRFNKLLVSQPSIKKIQKIAGDARTYHYQNTLAWGDNDERLLPAENYFHYTSKLRDLKAQFDSAVGEFVEAYPSLIIEAQRRLNGMFNQADYPTVNEIPFRYNFVVSVSPLAVASDFRVCLQADEIEAIRLDIELRTQEAQNKAMRELWDRLYEAVKHMADKLTDTTRDKPIFRDSLVENLTGLCELLPRLNVLGDANLERMRQEVEYKLALYPADSLRQHEDTRKQVASDAQTILDTMKGFMGS